MKKNVLGLDLGTTSIGFAHVIEGASPEQSDIVKIGVRVNPLTTDEQTNFEKGKPITINADRTLKRGARRNLDRYQQRRCALIEVLLKSGIITEGTKLAEDGKNTTHETWQLRAKAASEKITKEHLARVFLSINKKRGYKSSRKAKNEDEGQAIDGMAIAKRLYDENLTPGQLVYQLLSEDKWAIPDFYRSDLRVEFDKVWNFQKKFYPDILTDELYKELNGKGQRATSAIFWAKCKFNIAEIKELSQNLKNEKTSKLNQREIKKYQAFYWRSCAVSEKLEKEQVAFVLTEINSNLYNSSGYLGAISDRSKELYFNNETVGQYLYKQLLKNPHTRLKNQVFYRQDYLDEFEAIWKEQSKHYSELNHKLKEEIRDITIFYQRKLKSQKGLVSFCEFECREVEVAGKNKVIGLKVAPKSSPLFQEFKIWQVLHNLEFRNKETKEKFQPDNEAKQVLFDELNIKGNLSAKKTIELLGYKPKEWELNYSVLEGNRTNKALYEAYLKILDVEGYDVNEILKVKSNKDNLEMDDLDVSASKIKEMVRSIFETLNINTDILHFDAELDSKKFEQQSGYHLWHLLYSYEGDDSPSGNEILCKHLVKKFGFKTEHSKIIANIIFSDDYGSLSSKAMRKIYPFIKENNYSTACELAGYRHSKTSYTKEEIENRPLKDKLELLKKNSLRNPVVEKILNQMVNVVNSLIDENRKNTPNFRFDEIRIELARELKKNAEERAEMTSNINSSKAAHEKIIKLLQSEFGVKNPTRNDIIRFKLYEELKNNGYKDLYTDTYIPREILFSKQLDIDHIIPQARLFDDSFSNKTITYRTVNLDKGNRTAYDYIESKYGNEAANKFVERAKYLFEMGQKNKEDGISKAKFQKLQKRETDIGEGFIERDLRDSQYITRKAKMMLFEITRSVVPTTGSITNRLREDWGLINIMQELNFDRFKKLGLTEIVEKKDGTTKERIIDWTKRNDHRHHAMDALTVAFTKRSYIQYLNYLNARYNEKHKEHYHIKGIETKETHVVKDDSGNNKRVFKLPILNFRKVAKEHLENVIVSHKAKNKVVTKNKNVTKVKNGVKMKVELTPRGQLHKETVYGKYRFYKSKEEKIGTKFDVEMIEKVANPTFKSLLLQRLAENGNDPKKAFGGKNTLSKNPIYLNEFKAEVLPEKVTLIWLEEDYSIRKDVTPENFKDEKSIEKVLDEGVKRILLNRLKEFNNDPKKAFSDLENNPIWLNKAKGISIKRVTISGVKNAEPLHYKKDHLGNFVLDKQGAKIPADFVSTGNNHHVSIYRDEEGNLQENVISFFEAVERVSQGLPIIDKSYNQHIGWKFLFTMKQNEYFVFPNEISGFNPNEIDLLDPNNKKLISPNLFRVQKIATKNYMFRHHIETNVDESKNLRGIAWELFQTPTKLEHVIKVRVNHFGHIVSVGEF